MKLGIMQPYFLPYIGYFQLIHAVDTFVIYDNIEYTKRGWINRNRILNNGSDKLFTVPLKKDSDYLDVVDRYLADNSSSELNKILNQIKSNYSKAPYFDECFPIIQEILKKNEPNLFKYILNSIEIICKYFEIKTNLLISSKIETDEKQKAEKRVLSLCKNLNADIYINPIGGVELYTKEIFKENGILLYFIKSNSFTYKQFNNNFIDNLSIIDVMMFNSKDRILDQLTRYELI